MPPKRTGLKIALGVGIVLLSCYLLFSLRVHLALNHELELARKDGLWTMSADINYGPTPPADRNAAPIYERVCTAFEAGRLKTSNAGRRIIVNALNPGGESAFADLYQRDERFLSEFERAAAMPECKFQSDPNSVVMGRAWDPYDLFSALQLVCVQAMLLSRHNHAAQALDLIRRFAPMAHHVASNLLGEFQAPEMDKLVADAVQTILGSHGLEPRVAEGTHLPLKPNNPPDPT